MKALAQSNVELGVERYHGYYVELLASTSVRGFKQRIHAIVSRLGFSDFSFINVECANTKQELLNTINQTLLVDYFERELFAEDMIVKRALNSNKPFFSTNIFNYLNAAPFVNDMTKTMQVICQLNEDYNFYDYYHVPCVTSNGRFLLSVSICGVSAAEIKCCVHEASQSLTLLAEAVTHVVANHFNHVLPSKSTDVMLKSKPLRVLNALANNDLTIEQLASKLCMSTITANQHLKTARHCLGVKTNYAAIKKAICLGMITLNKTPGIDKYE